GRLVGRMLVERTAIGAEGGRYESPIAKLSKGDDRLSLLFLLNNSSSAINGYDLAQRLLARAIPDNEEYDVAWSNIVASVALKAMDEVEINLRTSFVLPEALLTIPLDQPGDAEERRNQPYTMLKREGDVTRYARNDGYPFLQKTQPAEIVERTFVDPLRAVLA